MASGSQTYSGICADLPVAPMKNSSVISEIRPKATSGCSSAALKAISRKSRVPNSRNARAIPTMNAKSPMRLTTNAFLPASMADGFRYQKPIRR